MTTYIRRFIETDTGHRVPNHKSKCRHIHGHRYRFEAEIEGDIITEEGVSEEGMVVDFSDIKRIANSFIQEKLDHAFMVWEQDEELIRFFNESEGHKPVIVPFTPTAENVAAYIFNELEGQFNDAFGTGLRLHSVKLWETPTSCAIFGIEDK